MPDWETKEDWKVDSGFFGVNTRSLLHRYKESLM